MAMRRIVQMPTMNERLATLLGIGDESSGITDYYRTTK
jgi:hypothetical protein